MKKLITPFGYVDILIDGKEIEYFSEKLEANQRLCPDIIGRYKISVEFEPDGKEHLII